MTIRCSGCTRLAIEQNMKTDTTFAYCDVLVTLYHRGAILVLSPNRNASTRMMTNSTFVIVTTTWAKAIRILYFSCFLRRHNALYHLIPSHNSNFHQQQKRRETMLECFTYHSLKEIPGNMSYHYKHGNINWPMAIYITLVHFVALMGVLAIPSCKAETLLFAFLLWPLRYARDMRLMLLTDFHMALLSSFTNVRSHAQLGYNNIVALASQLVYIDYGHIAVTKLHCHCVFS
jgi:hypothetical protein